MKTHKTLLRTPLMIALWIAFIMAVIGAGFMMVMDIHTTHADYYCFYESEIHPDDEPYVPALMKYAVDGFVSIIDYNPCHPEYRVNYWMVYLSYSLYVLYFSVVLFTAVLVVAALVYLFKSARKRMKRGKA